MKRGTAAKLLADNRNSGNRTGAVEAVDHHPALEKAKTHVVVLHHLMRVEHV
jgi:hypothetical protein